MFGVAHSTLLGHCWETPFQECYKILWSDHMQLVPAAAVAPVHSARFFAARWPFLWGDLLLLGLFNVTWCYEMWLDFLKSWIRAWQFIVNVQFVGHQLSLHSPGVGAWSAWGMVFEELGMSLRDLLKRMVLNCTVCCWEWQFEHLDLPKRCCKVAVARDRKSYHPARVCFNWKECPTALSIVLYPSSICRGLSELLDNSWMVPCFSSLSPSLCMRPSRNHNCGLYLADVQAISRQLVAALAMLHLSGARSVKVSFASRHF